MRENDEADIPIQQSEGASVVDLPESDGDATSLAAAETADWSSDIAFLKDSGGLEEWRSFTATLTPTLDATKDQLPKLTLDDDGHLPAQRLDSSAVITDAKGITPDAKTITPDVGVGDKPTLTSGGVPEFEDGQAIPGEPPRITDPLPAIPPGIRITIPSPTSPGFTVADPARLDKPGVVADPSLPIKTGEITDPAIALRPVEPTDPTRKFEDGQSVPGEPPRLTDPLPIVPPSIQRIVDHGALTGRKHDTSGPSLRLPNSRDTTPAGQAVTAFRASLRAAEAQTQAPQNPKLGAQLAAQMELKKHAVLNPEKTIKETTAAAAIVRKGLMRSDQGSDKGATVKPGGRTKELVKEATLRTPDGFVAKPAINNEKTDPRLVLNADLSASIHHERDKLGIASSLPVDGSLLHGTTGRELVAGAKLCDNKVTAGTGHLLEPAVAVKTYLPELTLVGKSQEKETQAIKPQTGEPHVAKVARSNEANASNPPKLDSQAIDFTPSTLSERGKIFLAAQTPIERSLLRHAAGAEVAAVHSPIERSLLRREATAEDITAHSPVERIHLRHSAVPEQIAAHTPVERIHLRHSAVPEQIAAHTPVERTHLKHSAVPEHIASHTSIQSSLLRQNAEAGFVASRMPITRSLASAAVGREFLASAIPQDFKATDRARLALVPSLSVKSAGAHTSMDAFNRATRPLNFTPIPDERSKLPIAENRTNGKSLGSSVSADNKKDSLAMVHAQGSTLSLQGQDSITLSRLASSIINQAAEPVASTGKSNPVADRSIPAAERTSHTIDEPPSDAEEALHAAEADETLPVADGDDSALLATKFKSLLSTVITHKSSQSTLAQTARSVDATPEQKAIRAESGPQNVSEKQLARTTIVDDHAEFTPAKLSGDLKLRVTYLHIGNRIFLLERQLVDKNSYSERPAAPSAELVVSAGVAALIAGRRLKRRRKNGEAIDNTDAGVTESVEEESLPTSDSNERSRESVPLSRAASRFSYMIQPGDSLTDLATAIWHDAEVGWLIAEVNKLKQEWQGSECSISLAERQVIELPLAEEVVDFYRSGVSTPHKNHKLTTIVTRAAFDDELSSARTQIQSNTASQIMQLRY
ncbi:MAG: hypothetical protein C0469_10565 [Cyanobacteria bacterium DS2.3.42]|nr:hypothetical protein [Cyanobacteria bacterium DS2.3.42]